MKNYKYLVMILALTLTAMLTACAPVTTPSNTTNDETTDETTDAPNDSEDVTIDFWFWEDFEGQEKLAYEEAWADYEKGKGIKINLESFSNSSTMHEKLIPALAANAGPDIIHTVPTWIPELVSMEAILALDDYFDEWESFKNNDVGEGILEMCRANQEHYYSVPFNVVVLYIYCRADLFEAAGVDYPNTMEEFYQACKDLTMDTNGDGEIDQYGFAMRGAANGHPMWTTLVFNAAENVNYLDENGNVAFNVPEVIEANQKYIDLYREGYCPPSSITDGMQGILQNFTTGTAAMLIHHVGSYNSIVEEVGLENIKIIPVPIGAGGRFVASDPSSVCVNAKSDNLEETLTFIEFMISPEIVDHRSRVLGRFPWQVSLLSDPYWKSNEALEVSTTYVGESIAPPALISAAEWANNLWPQTFQRALMGEITSEEMIEILAEGLVN